MAEKILVDADALRKEVSAKYREVAVKPDGEAARCFQTPARGASRTASPSCCRCGPWPFQYKPQIINFYVLNQLTSRGQPSTLLF